MATGQPVNFVSSWHDFCVPGLLHNRAQLFVFRALHDSKPLAGFALLVLCSPTRLLTFTLCFATKWLIISLFHI